MNFESDSLAARRRKVVFYGRVSTEMEAQIAALKKPDDLVSTACRKASGMDRRHDV